MFLSVALKSFSILLTRGVAVELSYCFGCCSVLKTGIMISLLQYFFISSGLFLKKELFRKFCSGVFFVNT